MQKDKKVEVESLSMTKRNYVKSERVPWDEYFWKIMTDCEKQSTCLLKHVGAVLVKNRRLLSTGYNGPPMGVPHCKICVRKEQDTKSYAECPSVHAEINCLIQCARFGISTEGAVIYVRYMPCFACTGALINARISKIIFEKAPVDNIAVQLTINAGIELCRYKNGKIMKIQVKSMKLPWV